MRRMLFAVLVAAANDGPGGPSRTRGGKVKVKIEVVSSQHNQVSGGDALISVTSRRPNRFTRCT